MGGDRSCCPACRASLHALRGVSSITALSHWRWNVARNRAQAGKQRRMLRRAYRLKLLIAMSLKALRQNENP